MGVLFYFYKETFIELFDIISFLEICVNECILLPLLLNQTGQLKLKVPLNIHVIEMDPIFGHLASLHQLYFSPKLGNLIKLSRSLSFKAICFIPFQRVFRFSSRCFETWNAQRASTLRILQFYREIDTICFSYICKVVNIILPCRYLAFDIISLAFSSFNIPFGI